MRHLLLISMLAAWVGLAQTAAAAAAAADPARFNESDFVGFSFAPARLVFDSKDLAQCLADATAQRCVLRGPVQIDAQSWREQFKSTGGVAVLTAQRTPLTITSGPTGLAPVGSDVGDNRLQLLDFNSLAAIMLLTPGARLRLSNLHLINFAFKTAYTYSPAHPYESVGVGISIWPTINCAPNTTFVGINLTATYTNPSDQDDCERYSTKSLSYLQQSFGVNNATRVSPSSNLVLGPITITVPVRNGTTGEIVGNATSIYKYLTVTCLEAHRGQQQVPSPGVLAAAIAVPVTVALLASGLFLVWWYRRRAHRRKTSPAGSVGNNSNKVQQHTTLLGDAEGGLNGHTGTRQGSGGSLGLQHPEAAASGAWTRRATNSTAETMWSVPASLDRSSGAPRSSYEGPAVGAGPGHLPVQHHSGQHPAASRQDQLVGPSVSSVQGLQGVTPHPGAPPSHYSGHSVKQDATGSRGPSAAISRQGSTSTYEAKTPMNSFNSCQQFGTVRLQSGLGVRRTSGDGQADTTTAVLKARSDANVLKDLKLGPLLGQGSYGHVYKGRWKATPVAVKIIEHYSSAEGVGSSRGNRISAGREMLFATSISHPNLVNTFHISTLSQSQRTAAARSWVADTNSSSKPAVTAGTASHISPTSSPDSSGSSSTTSGPQLDLLETWIVMELCERGSLERALKLGKLKKADGRPDFTGIYKALLDTASGLDYLHSIGVVHGDLKTANVLLKGTAKDLQYLIADFGISRVLDVNASHVSTGTHGTIVYMPKELLLSGRMTHATDIYSFGLMMWELLTSQQIICSEEGLSIGQMFYMIAYQDWRPQIPDNCPPGYADLMTACWHEDPEQRPTAQQLLRRLQTLQGQARQELVAARKARSAAADLSAKSLHLPPGLTAHAGSSVGSTARAAELDAAPSQAGSTDQRHHPQQQPDHRRAARALEPQASDHSHEHGSYQVTTMAGSIDSFVGPSCSTKGSNQDSTALGYQDTEDYHPYLQALLSRAASVDRLQRRLSQLALLTELQHTAASGNQTHVDAQQSAEHAPAHGSARAAASSTAMLPLPAVQQNQHSVKSAEPQHCSIQPEAEADIQPRSTSSNSFSALPALQQGPLPCDGGAGPTHPMGLLAKSDSDKLQLSGNGGSVLVNLPSRVLQQQQGPSGAYVGQLAGPGAVPQPQGQGHSFAGYISTDPATEQQLLQEMQAVLAMHEQQQQQLLQAQQAGSAELQAMHYWPSLMQASTNTTDPSAAQDGHNWQACQELLAEASQIHTAAAATGTAHGEQAQQVLQHGGSATLPAAVGLSLGPVMYAAAPRGVFSPYPGFSTSGTGFAGCLPDFPGSQDSSDGDAAASLQPYLAALQRTP